MVTSLQRWLDRTGVTQEQLAEASGVDQALISKYATGKANPGLRNSHRIALATGGQVGMDSWPVILRDTFRVTPVRQRAA